MSSHTIGSELHAGTEDQKHKALEMWDNIKGALIGVAATRFKEFVGEVVPGFHEQFQHTEEKARTVEVPKALTLALHNRSAPKTGCRCSNLAASTLCPRPRF